MIKEIVTNIQNQTQADKVFNPIKINDFDLQINFDFNNTDLFFPCGHAVLRVEGDRINSGKIISTLKQLGFKAKF